jgi:hypothetical protein
MRPPDHLGLLTRGRVLQMVDALEAVGATPIDFAAFHSFAFFTNVLSPVWDLHPLEGSVLKDERGPYFPIVQRELDHLIAAGALTIVTLTAPASRASMATISPTFVLNRNAAESVLASIAALPDEQPIADFLRELATAFAQIKEDRRDDAAVVDAAYSDPAIEDRRVVDFAEWVSPTLANPSWKTSEAFQRYAPPGVTLTRAEKLSMYMRLMRSRAVG